MYWCNDLVMKFTILMVHAEYILPGATGSTEMARKQY